MKKINTISAERAFSIIHKPIMTEKSTNLNQYNQYSFIVSKASNSKEIKLAIEKIFKVKVTKINTSIIKGKFCNDQFKKTSVNTLLSTFNPYPPNPAIFLGLLVNSRSLWIPRSISICAPTP